MANLKRIADAMQAEIELKDPETGAPMGVYFTLAGPENPRRKKQEFDRQRKLRAQMQKSGKIEFTDPEADYEHGVDMLCTATLGWRGYTDDTGAEIPYSAATASELYNDDERGWVRAQLQTAMNERERFIVRSVQS